MSSLVAFLVAGHIVSRVDIPSIPAIVNGFWITDTGNFTNKSDNTYWIPPSGVLYVQRYRGFK